MTSDRPVETEPIVANDRVVRAFAVLIGLAVPALLMGRTALAVAVILALAALARPTTIENCRRALAEAMTGWLGWLFLATIGCWLFSLINSIDPLRSLGVIVRTAGFVVIAVAVWSALAGIDNRIEICRRTTALASLVVAAVGILAHQVHPGFLWFVQWKGWIDQPIVTELKPIAAIGSLLLPILALNLVRERPSMWRLISGLAIIGFIALIILTNNRAAMAGILSAVGLLTVSFWVRGGNWKVYLWTLVISLALVAILIWLRDTRTNPEIPGLNWPYPPWLIDFQRQIIWKFTLEQALVHPLVGWGVNTINFTPGADLLVPGTYGLHVIPSHPHNWMVEVFAETGFIGLLPLCALVFLSVRTAVVFFKSAGDPAALALIALMGVYWGSGLFNFSFWAAWWQVAFLLLAAVCLASIQASGLPASFNGGNRNS